MRLRIDNYVHSASGHRGTERDEEEVRVGEQVHLGFGTRGGAGFYGTVTKIENGQIEIKNKEGKIYRGPLRLVSKDAGPNKKTVAKEAVRQLNFIGEMLRENNWEGTQYHSNSANNYLQSIINGGEQIPEWVNRNAGWLKSQGWRWYG